MRLRRRGGRPADDTLTDVEKLLIVAKPDAGLLNFAAHFDIDRAGAVHHDIGDLIARQQWLERTIAENVVANIVEQILLLGDRHHDVLDRDDLIDDVADFLPGGIGVELGELTEINGLDQGAGYRALRFVICVGTAESTAVGTCCGGPAGPVGPFPGVGAPRIGAPADANGARPPCGGADGGDGYGRSATAAPAGLPGDDERVPTTNATPKNADCYNGRCSNVSISGDNRLELFFFGSTRPVNFWASCRRRSVVR